MLQFWLGSTGVASVSVDTADVVCDVIDPLASGTGTATVAATDVATVAAAVSDAAISLGPVAVLVDPATVGSSVSDATPNELTATVEAGEVGCSVVDPTPRLWPTIGQRQSQTNDLLYERIHVGDTRIRRQSPDDAPRPLRQQEAV